MKLAVNTPKTITTVPEIQMVIKKSQTQRRCIVGGLVAVTLLFVLAVLSLVLVLVVNQPEVDAEKVYNMNVHTLDGKTMSEKITVTSTEEVIEVAEGTVIFDFASGFMVIYLPYLSGETCYVTSFNTSEIESSKQLKQEESNMDIYQTEAVMKRYKVTDIWINHRALGPQSLNMCSSKALLMLRNVATQGNRLKRKVEEVSVEVCVLWGALCAKVTVS